MHLTVPLTEQKALQISLQKKSTCLDCAWQGSSMTRADSVVIDFPYKKPVYNSFSGTLCDFLTDGVAVTGYWDPQIALP